ncbi:MAG: VCBS repeat-containing protein [Phycisphaerales bacterium]
MLIAIIASGCDDAGSDGTMSSMTAPTAVSEQAWFTDVAAESGLVFEHTTGATGAFYFPEIAGSGCGLFDYDGDGDLDVYVLQAYTLPGPPGEGAGRNRLFRNEIVPTGRLRFVDVTERTGLGDRGYGMGMAVADYDNDGDLDLYVTNFGSNRLFRNDGDDATPRFTDVSATAVPPEDRWSTSATFVDYDADGFVDLFVTNYVNFSVRENKVCHSPTGRRDYCGPQSFDPVPDRLFRNNGDGTFSDVTGTTGIGSAFGSGLGVVCADFNGDGHADIYVANDGNANQLWMNRGDGTFEDTALLAGTAYNADGRPEAGMGVTAGDFDLDGDQDIFLSHLEGEHNTLLVNDGTGMFDDRTEDFALAAMSWPYTGFGTRWADLDADGYLDLFVANGAVKIVPELAFEPYPYGNPNQVVRNLGPPDFTFTDVSAAGGPTVRLVETSRAAAFGDVDNDGDVDVLVSTSNGPLRLFRNDVADGRSWLGLRLVGTGSNRSAIGALVTLVRPGRPGVVRRVHADASYCAAHDLRVFFALGGDQGPQTVTVRWPGTVAAETFTSLRAGVVSELRQGSGAS